MSLGSGSLRRSVHGVAGRADAHPPPSVVRSVASKHGLCHRSRDGPLPVQQAYVLWLVAIAAGLFETLVIVIASDESGAGLLAGVIVRFAVFALAVYLAIRMRAGQNWARSALTGLLGVLGLLSLLIGPVTWPSCWP